MRTPLHLATALALTLGVATFGHSAVRAQPYGEGMMGGYGPGYGYGRGMMGGYGPGFGMGPWMMGPGMMGGMMGPGMMGGYGPGYGPGWWHRGPWGSGWYGPPSGSLNLSTADVKNELERWLAWQGNPRLKVGDVKERDADTIVADIVTKDGSSLVERFVVNRRTGFYRPE